jgi:hypothetical protein
VGGCVCMEWNSVVVGVLEVGKQCFNGCH